MATTTIAPCPPVPHCPVCGGLDCLCRPRFFAGQLLTEEDLNRLENYIIGKNKLHNRYLHGWGVVCGLEVICHQCKGFVTVRSGYALSPCGDDIIVCSDAAVNVCDLINQCRDVHEWDCDPAWPRPDPLCGDQDEDWVIYICYDEKPSRGVMSLRGGSGGACCSRCSCGGSSGCGCGCHEKMSGHGNGNGNGNGCKTPKPKSPPQCEPTITCEGYNFKLRKVPKQREPDPGEFVNRLKYCFAEIADLQKSLDALTANRPLTEVLAIRARMFEFLDHHSIYSCDLYQRILRVELPPADAHVANHFVVDAKNNFGALLREILRECICSALLPPCVGPAEENCVPIATLTLNCKDGCRVVRICNWEGRRIVIGFPTLEYWFEALALHSGLTTALVNFCCGRQEIDPHLMAGDPVGALLAEAVKAQGKVKSQSVYKWLTTQFKSFTAKLTK